WPDGFVCGCCGVIGEPWIMARGVFRCKACHGNTSLTAGTVFQDTRKPLRTWFLAMWFTTSQKNGVSALGLQRVLGLGSYETAWTWMHKLRRAMVRPGRDRLTGEIEIDETYVGGPEEGKRGREIEKKSVVVVAAEKNGRGIGRIRLRRVKDVSAESLLDFIRETVDPGATIHTDGWKGYALACQRRATSIASQSSAAGTNKLTKSCRAFITSPRCSSGGCSERSRAVFNNSISITTSMNSRFASTAAAQTQEDCSFTASPNKLSPSVRRPTFPLFSADVL